MNARRLERFELLLLAERARLNADLNRLAARVGASGATDTEPGDDGSASASGATDEDDAAVAARIVSALREVDEALRLIHESPHDYGICLRCGRPIPDERLEILPAARLCGRSA